MDRERKRAPVPPMRPSFGAFGVMGIQGSEVSLLRAGREYKIG